MSTISKKNMEAVEALRKLFSNTYKPAEGRDAVCYRYNVLSNSWGKDVLSQKFFSGANFYAPTTFGTYMYQYRLREKAALGGMAGEK